MSIIHITSPAGEQSRHDEPELRALWEQGRLQEGTRYWMEGMSESRPLGEFYKAPAVSATSVPPAPSISLTRSYAKDPRRLTSFLIVMLWISVGTEVVLMLSNLMDFFTPVDIAAIGMRHLIIGIGSFAVFLVTGFAFLKWIYRANLNCRGFGAEGMKFTPGWSIGYYFIPILNLVRPYYSMKEIWKVSHNPADWKSYRGNTLVDWWWALWLIYHLFPLVIYYVVAYADSISQWRDIAWVLIANLIYIPLCLVAIKLIKTITRKQEEFVHSR